MVVALTGGEGFSHDDGWCICTPHFSFLCLAREKRNGPCTVQREKRAGAEFDRRGQIRPRYGGWSELVPIELANLLPAASDPVPQRGTLPQL